MLFWDLRACKFLESTMNSNRAVTLKVCRTFTQLLFWVEDRLKITVFQLKMFEYQSPSGFKRMGAKGRHFHGRLSKSEVRIPVQEWHDYLINYQKARLTIFCSLGTSPPSTHTATTQVARGSSLLEVLFSAGSRYGRDVTVTF